MKTIIQIANRSMPGPEFNPGAHEPSLPFTPALMPPTGAVGNLPMVVKCPDVMHDLHLS